MEGLLSVIVGPILYKVPAVSIKQKTMYIKYVLEDIENFWGLTNNRLKKKFNPLFSVIANLIVYIVSHVDITFMNKASLHKKA